MPDCNKWYALLMSVKSTKDHGILVVGFYIVSIVWVVVGTFWLLWGWRTLKHLQKLPLKNWRIINRRHKTNICEEEIEESRFKYFYCF